MRCVAYESERHVFIRPLPMSRQITKFYLLRPFFAFIFMFFRFRHGQKEEFKAHNERLLWMAKRTWKSYELAIWRKYSILFYISIAQWHQIECSGRFLPAVIMLWVRKIDCDRVKEQTIVEYCSKGNEISDTESIIISLVSCWLNNKVFCVLTGNVSPLQQCNGASPCFLFHFMQKRRWCET